MGQATAERAGAAVQTLIVDDEKLARDELAFLLGDYPEIEIVGEASNGLEALEMIEAHEPDLVFLDVQMPGLDGLHVARQVIERGDAPRFIFATAFDQYAVDAFDVDAADYLLKPIEKKRLDKAVERAKKLLDSVEDESSRVEELLSRITAQARPPAKLLVRSSSRMLLVDAGELIYATIADGAITITASELSGLSNYRTIEELQSHLDPQKFWRPHRSYLVNIDRIKEVVPWFKSSYQLRMDDPEETEIPVSRAQTKRLRELFKL